jgi:hypothetical protein
MFDSVVRCTLCSQEERKELSHREDASEEHPEDLGPFIYAR